MSAKIAVLASGEGSTLEAVVRADQEGLIDVKVGLVISDRSNAGVFKRVSRLNDKYNLNIGTRVINGRLYPGGKRERGQTLEESAAICKVLDEGGFDLVVLMGYMRIVVAEGDLMKEYGWLPEYNGRLSFNRGIHRARMLNTHPGILPATADTYGIKAQKKVLNMSLPFTAHTVHAVAARVDGGPVFAEHEIPVVRGDSPESLFRRVQRIEKAFLPIDIDKFIRERKEFGEK